MKKTSKVVLFAAAILLLATASIAMFVVIPKVVLENDSWLRPVHIYTESGALTTLPKDLYLGWGYADWENLPVLQHTPIVLSQDYNDVRIFQYKDGKVTIRDKEKVIYQKDLGKEWRILIFRFSPDLKRFFYVANRWEEPGVSYATKNIVVTDNWTSEEYDKVSLPVFSDDLQHFSFGGQKIFKPIVVGIPSSVNQEIILDGKVVASHEVGQHDSLDELDSDRPITAFNPVNNKLAYIVNDRGNPYTQFKGASFVVYDDKEGPIYSAIEEVPFFSKNGASMAYAALKQPLNLVAGGGGNSATVICDGEEGPSFEGVSYAQISADGKTCVYLGGNNAGETGMTDSIIANGKVIATHPVIFDVVLGSDGKTIAYKYSDHVGYDAEFVHFGEKNLGPFKLAYGILLPTPDNTDVAFNIKVQSGTYIEGPFEEPTYKERIVLGTESGSLFDRVYNPIFYPDQHVLVYLAEEKDKMMVVVGNTIVGKYDDVWQPIIENESLIFVARQDKTLLRVVVKIIEE